MFYISKMLSNHVDFIHVSDACLSDFYKDAYGIRPRGYYKEWWTPEELEKEIDHLSKIAEENYHEECEREAKALVAFENLIEETIAYGAKDKKTAIKWLMDAEDVDLEDRQDVEHFFWGHRLSFEKIDEFTKYVTS